MTNSSSPITADDFRVAASNAKAAQRIADEVASRREKDPKFSADDLRREVQAAGTRPAACDATAENFRTAANDAKAAQRIYAEVASRREKDSRFTVDDLRREAQATAAAPVLVSLEDFRTAAINAPAAQRISAAVASRREKDPKFTAEDLRRELAAKTTTPQPAAVAVTPEAFGASAAGVLASLDAALRRRGTTPAAPVKNPVVHKMRLDGCQCNAAAGIHQHYAHEIVIAQLKAEGVTLGSKQHADEYQRRLNRPRSVKWQQQPLDDEAA